jgi:hypothetical protein
MNIDVHEGNIYALLDVRTFYPQEHLKLWGAFSRSQQLSWHCRWLASALQY